MDNIKVGNLIRKLRKEHGMTQLQLAEKLHISDRTVSKWERGLGSPDVSLITALSQIFEVDLQNLLTGELQQNKTTGGNIRKMKFFVCPDCGNLVAAIADTSVTCCGRKLKVLEPIKAPEGEKLSVQTIEQDYFISSNHEMSRDHYIAFLAFVTSDTVILRKLYPEWDLQVRIPIISRGRLLWYCNRHGLFYQEVSP